MSSNLANIPSIGANMALKAKWNKLCVLYNALRLYIFEP